MADLIFKNTPWGDVTLTESMPAWQKNVWITILTSSGFLPQKPPFVPTYEEVHYSQADPQVPPSPLSIYYFASEETAIELMHRFGAEQVAMVKKAHTVPPAYERWLVFPDGIAVNAGQLAWDFIRNPEDQSVSAEQEAKARIDEARAKNYTLANAQGPDSA